MTPRRKPAPPARRMRAVIFHAPKDIRLESVPIPKPGPGEVLVRVGAALTCGTDFKAYRQGHRVLLGKPPSPFGHEFAGTVEEAGPGAEGFKPGMRVVAANSAPCDDCFFCKRTQPQLCDRLKLHNGAYAEYDLVPAHIVRHNLYPLDPSTKFSTAALSEPLSCALHAVDVMRVVKEETVAILGAGTMSLLLIQSLMEIGCRILVVGRNPKRLKTARAMGAHGTVSVLDRDPVAYAKKATSGRGADCVFEAVGTPETWRQSIAMARKGGRVCLFGGCASGTQVPVDAHRVHYEQIRLQGVFHHTPRYFARALTLLSSGRVKTDLLLSEEIRLDSVPAFFKRMHRSSNPKAVVIP